MAEIDHVAAAYTELACDRLADVKNRRDRIRFFSPEETGAPKPIGHEQRRVAHTKDMAERRRALRPQHENRGFARATIAIAVQHDSEPVGAGARFERGRDPEFA